MRQFVVRSLPLLLCLAAASPALAEDLVEFLSGAKARGDVEEIRKSQREFDFRVTLGGRSVVRTYPFAQVHAVTLDGQRFVLTEKASGGENPGTAVRSRSEVLELIRSVGPTPPDWYEETPLEYPDTLDLSWPLKPPTKGWNNQVNVGQYIWDIINPNPNRWKSAVRLVHHEMTLHQNDPALLRRDMRMLGGMYFRLFQDYPRAAFWFRQADVGTGDPQSVALAECYWRLGCRPLAMETLRGRAVPLQAIKLLGDMGQTDRAVQLAGRFSQSGRVHEAYLLAGDACRLAGRYDQAISFYQRVIDADEARNEDYGQRYRGRARDSIEAIRLFEQADVRRVANGSYRDSSVGYNGPVEVEVTVADGEIADVQVTEHQEKQFYAALKDTPEQILDKQSVQDIDGTSGATITSQAIVNAAAKALAQGSQ